VSLNRLNNIYKHPHTVNKMAKKIDNSVLITLIIVVGVLLLAVLIFWFMDYNSAANTVSTTGTSSIKVLPDIVGIYFNVQTEGKTADEASTKNSEIVESMKTSLEGLGFKEGDIQTQSFSVNPKYDWTTGKQRITGYTAVHSIKVEILMDSKDKIGKSIDAGINAGAGISYINYELTQKNQNAYKAQAIKLATQDAQIKAGALTEGAGKRLGDLISVSTNDYGYYPYRVFSADASSGGIAIAEEAKVATDIQPSEQEITSSVTAVFRIK